MDEDQHFQKLKTYLKKIKNADYEILEETEILFQFIIRNKFYIKLFTVHYRDSYSSVKDRLQYERPINHYYYLQFDQDNVPMRGNLGTVFEWKWYKNEDDVLSRVKILKSRYNY